MFTNNVKNIRKKNSGYLAQLLIDQMFYDKVLEGYDEPGLRGRLAKVNADMAMEKEKLDAIIRASGRKGKSPEENEISKYKELAEESNSLSTKINEFKEIKDGKRKGQKAIEDVSKIQMIIDDLPAEKIRELNNL